MRNMFRKIATTALAVACTVGVAACGATPDAGSSTATSADQPAEKTKIVVFAAASMTESLTKAGDQFMAENPQYELVYNYDSSGTLKTQIQEGADCDVFISAGQKQMNQLDAEADPEVNTEGLDLIDTATRFDILENHVTLVVPEGNPANIESFDQLATRLEAGDILMCMGNSDVPVGQYTAKILAFYNLDEATLANSGVITYASNVKEVTSQVSEGTVDCGVIYQTDAYSAGLTIVDQATGEMCGKVVYPAAVCKNAQDPEGAQKFLDFLKGSEASADFEEVGFTPLAK